MYLFALYLKRHTPSEIAAWEAMQGKVGVHWTGTSARTCVHVGLSVYRQACRHLCWSDFTITGSIKSKSFVIYAWYGTQWVTNHCRNQWRGRCRNHWFAKKRPFSWIPLCSALSRHWRMQVSRTLTNILGKKLLMGHQFVFMSCPSIMDSHLQLWDAFINGVYIAKFD